MTLEAMNRHLSDEEVYEAARELESSQWSSRRSPKELGQHLGRCELCQGALEQTRAIIQYSDPGLAPPQFVLERALAIPKIERARSLFSRLTSWTKAILAADTSTMQPAFAIRRAGLAPAPTQTVWRWKDGEITVRWTPGRPGRVTRNRQTGNLLGVLDCPGSQDVVAEIVPLKGRGPVRQSNVDDYGEFEFNNVPSGSYKLKLSLDGHGVEIGPLELQ